MLLETALDQPLRALPVLFLAGVATSITPCIYPMIPITIGILGGGGGAEQRSRRRTVAYTLLYALGLALVYASLGLLAGLSGTLFGSVSSNRWAYLLMGTLLLLAALAMLDVFRGGAGAADRLGRTLRGALGLGLSHGGDIRLVAAPQVRRRSRPCSPSLATPERRARVPLPFVFSLGMTALLIAVGLSAGTWRRCREPGAG
jgi:thiol:disulfide interchange protein DsbD